MYCAIFTAELHVNAQGTTVPGGVIACPMQAFLGELVFHPSPQVPAQLKTTFLSQA